MSQTVPAHNAGLVLRTTYQRLRVLLAIAIMLLWRGVPTDASSSGDVVTVPTPR